MVKKVREFFEKTIQFKNNYKSKNYNLRGQRNTRYHEKVYQINRNPIISILFLIKHNRILSRLLVYKKAFDISRKASRRSSDTNPFPNIIISQITGCICLLLYSCNYLNIFIYFHSII